MASIYGSSISPTLNKEGAAMAAISIGIDLCQNPLRVGCKFAQALLVQEGSKGANLVKARIEDQDDKYGAKAEENMSASRELVHCFEDARSLAKSYFGSPNIKRAVVVVPSHTNFDTRQFTKVTGNRASIPIQQVIPEHIAVVVAYADKTKPTSSLKIVIVSSTEGACDVHVVYLTPSGKSYMYEGESPESRGREPPEHTARSALVQMLDRLRKLFSLWLLISPKNLVPMLDTDTHNLFFSPPTKDKMSLEKVVVFVGKSAELEKIREIIIKGFSEVKEWGEMEDSEQLAAYGAAVVASSGEPVLYSGDGEPLGMITRHTY